MNSLHRERRMRNATYIESVILPARPALLMALQREMSHEEPNLVAVEHLVLRDAAIAGHLLQAANSPFYRAAHRIDTVREVLLRIGLNQCSAILTGILARRVLTGGGMAMMARFWDVSEKRAKGLSFMARELGFLSPELAYNFGLFCDIGIPVLKGQINTYAETLSAANRTAAGRFLQIEESRHGVNHADVGALLAERWGICSHVTRAVGMHHNPEILRHHTSVSPSMCSLVAANILVEKAIEAHRGNRTSLEWRIGGRFAAEELNLSDADVEDFFDRLVHGFSEHEWMN